MEKTSVLATRFLISLRDEKYSSNVDFLDFPINYIRFSARFAKIFIIFPGVSAASMAIFLRVFKVDNYFH